MRYGARIICHLGVPLFYPTLHRPIGKPCMPGLDQPIRGERTMFHVCNEILSSYLPGWRQPDETSGASPSPFVITPGLGGHWPGT